MVRSSRSSRSSSMKELQRNFDFTDEVEGGRNRTQWGAGGALLVPEVGSSLLIT